MSRAKLLETLAFVIVFIFLVNLLANKFYWYYSIWYFDIIMHFLGGFWVGLVFIWLFYAESLSLRLVLKIILGVLLVGILWEVFEILVNNNIAQNPFNTPDTTSDLLFDLSGGLCAILYPWKRRLK